MTKVRWGILGVASIATRRVIPAMQQGECSEVAGIASRDPAKAQAAAQSLGIPRSYGSYNEMLADPAIEAVYNPLPNHLHVPWSIRCAEAGKHVLCEKPLSLSVAEARDLVAVRDRTGVKIGEAFMVHTHPRWLRVRELVRAGRIGALRSIVGYFSYFSRDPGNVRNVREFGGGGLYDIGCYCIHLSRFAFEEEPLRVVARVEDDPDFHVDRLASAILDFPAGQSIFTCSTQIPHYQRMQFFGTDGRIDVERPFNVPTEVPTRILIDDGRDLEGSGVCYEEIAPCNQYTIQGDLFSQAVRGHGDVPVPLEDSLRNMAVIEALFRSAASGAWEKPCLT